MNSIQGARALTFDLFGTILDLGGSLEPPISAFLERVAPDRSATAFWDQWRRRQRLEQYQDTIMMLGHAGYLETVRRALHYVLRQNSLEPEAGHIRELMAPWEELRPFPEVVPALERLRERYRLVVLSNGDPDYLQRLVRNRLEFSFDSIVSASGNGAFKPHPGVYRRAAGLIGLEVHACAMVSSNAFDCVGARACGFQAVYVNRYGLPVEDTPYQPALTLADFTELADALP